MTRRLVCLASAWLAAAVVVSAQVAAPPATREPVLAGVARGVALAQFDASQWVGAPGPIAVCALRLDPAHVRLALVLAQGRSPALEPVAGMASRAGALAAINAGFFGPGGRPAGLLALDGGIVSAGAHPRGAVGLGPSAPATVLLNQVKPILSAARAWGGVWPLAWFEPQGQSSPLDWLSADAIIGGAGLILTGGRALEAWDVERMRPGFATDRHPRTVVGRDPAGATWLLAIDGRRPGHSMGVTFAELAIIAARLGLTDAVNLDGGGSTTMVVGAVVVNRPSDLTGPRPVSDAILVLPR